jgi:hypothetical protein
MQGLNAERMPRVHQLFKKDGATYKVMDKASGVQLDQLSEDEIAEIPQEHFNQLAADVRALNEKGLQMDPSKTSNFFYDSNKGFIIIDLSDSNAQRPHEVKNINQAVINELRAALIGASQNEKIIEKIGKALQ